MRNNHYRDHTIQQDGWTVLAPPPAPENPGLPPPYTPEAPAGPDIAVVTAAAFGGSQLAFDVPTNTNVIGAAQITRSKKYGRGVPFNTAFIEICETMGLNTASAQIGYKWDNDKAAAPVRALATAGDWNDCPERGIGQTERARTRKVTCLIHNLNPPEETSALAKTNKKRKETEPSSPKGKKVFEYTSEYRALKKHLMCAKHKRHCWIRSDIDHRGVEPHQLTLWAKEIAVGNANPTRPLENILFQDFFLPQRKRARSAQSTSTPPSNNGCTPTIHVTVNTGPGSSSSSRVHSSPARVPLGSITTTTLAANMDHPAFNSEVLSFSDDTGSSIQFPPVTDLLQSIDDSGDFEDSAVLPFPAVVFTDDLHKFQITRADQVPVAEAQFYVDQIHMPIELAERFVAEAISAIEGEHEVEGKGKEKLY
ncbi:hypothetical protein K438DRAFT_2100978 [Mycena galopus ATCC 62051]|nr:hypothetical protein K438DRAFT_2100978 [Mycena galopus ATCC 62051]